MDANGTPPSLPTASTGWRRRPIPTAAPRSTATTPTASADTQDPRGRHYTFTYDTLNRLSTKAAPGEATVTYAYDQASHRSGWATTARRFSGGHPGELATSFAYDPLNRPPAAAGARRRPDDAEPNERDLRPRLRRQQPAHQPGGDRQQLAELPRDGNGELHGQ